MTLDNLIEENNTTIIKIIEQMRSLPYDKKKESQVNLLLDFWSNYINNNPRISSFINVKNQEIYPLDIYIQNYKITIEFYIKHVRELIKHGQLSTSQRLLGELLYDLSYNNTNSKRLFKNALDNPLIAVLFPLNVNNTRKNYTLIDGNHRVSAAIYSNVNIPVICINNVILDLYAFVSNSDWLFYNLVLGFNLTTSDSIRFYEYFEYLQTVVGKQ